MDFPHGVLAVDTETTGLDWVRGRIGAVSLAWDVGPSNNLATRNVGLALQLVEEARDAGVKLVFHNAAFDAHFMLRHGVSIDWDNYEDTLIMARLRDNLGDAGLKDLGERYLGVPPNQRDALDDWLKANKFKKGDILQAPDELLLPYAAQDARLTLQLYLHFRDTRSYPGYETILAKEYRVRAIIFEAEEAGVPLDVGATAELAVVLEDERGSIEDKLRELGGGERNFSSPTQVASLLFDELGYPEIAGRSTDDYVLTMLQAPVPQLIRAYRERSKLAGYLKSYLELEQGGFLYPSLNTVGARTHRFTCKEPNLQQIPARNRWGLRKIFRAHDGWLIGADFDKQELRIGASIANDTRMMEDLVSGEDIYRTMGSQIFHKPAELVTGMERSVAKNTALGLNYGMGATRMAEQLTAQFGRVFTINEVTGIRMGYKAMYPQTIQALSRASREAERVGFVTNPWGRRLYVDPEKSYRAWNYLIQPSGGDALKDAIIHVAEVLCAWGGHIIMPIHDELVCWVPDMPTHQQLREFEEAMKCTLLALPLTASAHMGRSMQELK